MKHNLAFVRMNPADRTFHCERHGLLTEDEAADVMARAGINRADVERRNSNWPHVALRLIDAWGHFWKREACEP